MKKVTEAGSPPVPHQVVGGDEAEDEAHAQEDVHVAASEEEVEAPAAAVIDFRQRRRGHQECAPPSHSLTGRLAPFSAKCKPLH